MQKRIYSTVVLLMMFCAIVSAQNVLLQEEPDTTGEVPLFGRNRAVYAHPLIKLGAVIPVYEDGGEIGLLSTTGSAELRTKAKICSWKSLILDFGYRCDRYSIGKDDALGIPGFGGVHKRERLSLHNISFSLCDRINFGRRGNILGIYTDVGFYGDLLFRGAHLMVNEYYDSNSETAERTIQRVKQTHLPFLSRFNYGFTARFGWEWGSFFAMYRINDLVVDRPPLTIYSDFPRFMAGVEMYGIFD